MVLTRAQQDWSDQFRKEHESCYRKLAKPNVLVCGYTGAGKSSLIQAICGRETVPDDKIGHGKPLTPRFEPYRNPFITFWDSKGFEPGNQEESFIAGVKQLVRDLQRDPCVDNHIHLVWYTIQGPGASVTSSDIQLIHEIFDLPCELVLITKNDITKEVQRKAIIGELESKGVPADSILLVSEEHADSLKAVVAKSIQLLPEAYKKAFISGQLVDLDSKNALAQTIIHGAAVVAAGIGGGNPLPVADAVLITPVQIGMIAALAVNYGLPQETVTFASGALIAQVAGVMVAGSLTKFFPFLGQAVQAAVAGGLTEALGQIVNQYLVACCQARIKGQPMPEFSVPGGNLAGYLARKSRRAA